MSLKLSNLRTMNEPAPDLPLASGEAVQLRARVGDAAMVVTDQRLLVVSPDRHLFDVAIHEVRRIQFDIEKKQPATLVIVPEQPSNEPQVLAVPHHHYAEVAEALVLVGLRLAESPDIAGSAGPRSVTGPSR